MTLSTARIFKNKQTRKLTQAKCALQQSKPVDFSQCMMLLWSCVDLRALALMSLGGFVPRSGPMSPAGPVVGGEDGAVVSVTSVGTGAALCGPTSQLVQNHRPCVC